MLQKLLKAVKGTINGIGSMNIRGLPRFMIYAYLTQLFLLVVIYIAGLVYVWYDTGKPDFVDNLALIKLLIAGDFILMLYIVGKGLYDNNKNGEPDFFEEEPKPKEHDGRP
jgi:hypothetical protein